MTGLLARLSKWLVHREPLWLVGGAGAVLDVATYVVPVVPAGWHVWVNGAVVVLGVISGRALVSPVLASGGTVELSADASPTGWLPPATTGPAGSSNVRRVGTVLDKPAPTTPPAGMPDAQMVDTPPDQPPGTP